MKLAELVAMERERDKQEFRVSFEWAGDGFLRSDYLPERGEPACKSEEEAWALAERLAAAAPSSGMRYPVNIYVVSKDWSPVSDYGKRKLRRYPDAAR